jgi:DivIVA domain-containing protein
MDETFHLTPLDVRRYDFGRALRGYDPERVEQFREQVAEEMERLARQSQDFENKAKGFHEQLRAFRERDKALNDALVSAQQLRSEIRDTADRESAVLLREAQAEADRLVDDARNQVRALETHLADLDRMRRNHLTQMRVVAERQLAELAAAESFGADQAAQPRYSPRTSQAAIAANGDVSQE